MAANCTEIESEPTLDAGNPPSGGQYSILIYSRRELKPGDHRMRGADYQTAAMFSYISPEGLAPRSHPLRAIRPLMGTVNLLD